MPYLTPGAMSLLQARRQFNVGADSSPDFFGPPQEPPEGGGGIVTTPPVPVPPPNALQRSINRTTRNRQFLQQNPGRAGAPMGRDAQGNINYDPSTGIGQYHLDQRQRQQQAANLPNLPPLGAGNLPGAATGPRAPSNVPPRLRMGVI